MALKQMNPKQISFHIIIKQEDKTMGFLDKLSGVGSAISAKGQEAANKAKEMGGVTQLKGKITMAEGSIRAVYTELGAKLFEEQPDWLASNYPELVEKANAFKAEIARYESEIEALKQTTADANAKLQEGERNRKAMAAQAAAAEAAAKAAAASQAEASQSAPEDKAE